MTYTEKQYKEFATALIRDAEDKAGMKLGLSTKILLKSILIVNSKHFFNIGKNSVVPKDKIIGAYMILNNESENKSKDSDKKKYFQGGKDAIVMVAKMLGYSDEWIKEGLIR